MQTFNQANNDYFHRWAVILAGGDGKRLLPLTRRITGDDRPKQFCALTGGETLLDQTRRRAARVIPVHQTLLMMTQTHERYFRDQVRAVPAARQLIQPYNHGTAPAIAWSLTRLKQMDPQGLVAFFPSDHHFADDLAFAEHVDLAFAEAKRRPERVFLLGIEAEAPEEAYGWIEPGAVLNSASAVFDVNRFWEKPSRAVAARLMRGGCLWNSFIMIGTVEGFLQMLRRTLPDLLARLETLTPGFDEEGLRDVYHRVPATNFSDDVLAKRPSDLAVIRAQGLGWSDLGEPQRVFSALACESLAAVA